MKNLLKVQLRERAGLKRLTPCASALLTPNPGAHGVTHLTQNLMVRIISLFFCLTIAFLAPAQSPPARQASGRYLLIVDTSSAMKNRLPAVQKALSDLLLSGMHAQLRAGDTIGVWTYNEQLYAGHLPLQRWTPETESLVASNVQAFLETQTFEKSAHFSAVWPELENLVKHSEKLTVLFVSAGSDTISGAPFASSLNAFFKKNARQQKRKRMPFVIVLRSYRGKFTGGTLNLAPWPVEFPPFPPEAQLAAEPKPKPPPPKVEPRPTAPPLIVIGEKPKPDTVAPAAESNSVVTKPAASPTPTKAATEPAPTETAETASSKPNTPSETTPAVKPTPPQVAATSETTPTQPTVVSSSTETPHSPTPPSVKAEPAPTTPSASADESKPEPATPAATKQQAPKTPPEQVATGTPPEKVLGPAKLLIIGAVFVVLAGAVFFLIRRRTQTNTRISLITRSMDQENK